MDSPKYLLYVISQTRVPVDASVSLGTWRGLVETRPPAHLWIKLVPLKGYGIVSTGFYVLRKPPPLPATGELAGLSYLTIAVALWFHLRPLLLAWTT